MRTAVLLLLVWPLVPSAASPQLRYEREYPTIDYAGAVRTDRVAALQAKIEAGDVELRHDPRTGYLEAVLRALDIPISSQSLVFTKTSFQRGLIAPDAPRAIYFSDDVYVAWVQESPVLEISAVDPDLGAVFYTLPQKADAPRRFKTETHLCLRCHDSRSMTGGGVPRHIMGSGVPDARGGFAFHEGWFLTTQATPLSKRWGGWYVTGTHGDAVHLGNVVITDPASATRDDLVSGANVVTLTDRFDTAPYLSEHSDIVALLVLEHQVDVQNAITRVSYDVRTAMAAKSSEDTAALVADRVEMLLRTMLCADEAPLAGPIRGTTTFASELEARGPKDAKGRSLRDLDLKTRLLRYPLSYLIYSKSFRALPEIVRVGVYRRLRGEISYLSSSDHEAIVEILEATLPEFAASGLSKPGGVVD